MPSKYIGLIIFIWVLGSLLGAVLEAQQVGAAEEATLNPILSWQKFSSEESWGILDMVGFLPTFFASLVDMLMFNFSFITGTWIWVKWILLAPIMGIVVYGLAVTFIGILRRTI